MNMLPTSIEVASARLPATYEQAKIALASCERIDECWEWASKAEALASYAKMADDDTLRQLADRIQARAVRRMGELLKEFDGRGRNPGAGVISQAKAAADAGISKRQKDTAVAVSNVPATQFEAAIEAEKPATVTALAEMGKVSRTVPPDSFKKATHLIGTVTRFAEFCEANDPASVADGVTIIEYEELYMPVGIVLMWLDQFATIVFHHNKEKGK